MQKKDLGWVVITLLYTVLFHNAGAGINQLLFSIVAVTSCYLLFQQGKTTTRFLIISAAVLSSGAATFWYGTDLPIYANRIALLMLPIIAAYENSSFFSSLISGIYTTVLGVFLLFIKKIKRENTSTDLADAGHILKRIILLMAAIGIALIFLLLYAFINPIMANALQKINFDFLSVDLLYVIICGVAVALLFVYPIYLRKLNQYDNSDNTLSPIEKNSWFRKILSVDGELFLGTSLLILVNLFLLFSNSLDIYYHILVRQLPAEVSLSEYVHSGAESVIVAIVLATLILLYFFRNELNFYAKNKLIVSAAYIWILQNIVAVFFAANRNILYIQDYGLTYKRIGLLFFFLLCICGLITVFIKIKTKKNIWYLFTTNYVIAFAVLSIALWIDWDNVITSFNLNHFQHEKKMEIDERYLVGLSHTNLPQLYSFYIVKQKQLNSENEEVDIMSDSFSSRDYYWDNIQTMILNKYDHLKQEIAHETPQSFCITKHIAVAQIETMKKQAK